MQSLLSYQGELFVEERKRGKIVTWRYEAMSSRSSFGTSSKVAITER
jgi:hypothetical protein